MRDKLYSLVDCVKLTAVVGSRACHTYNEFEIKKIIII